MKDIYKRALGLAVPMMIQNGITNAVGLVDNIMVGSVGTDAMTAVSIAGQLIFVFNLAVFGGLAGPGIYAAQYFGQGNSEGFRQTFRIKHWICFAALIIGILTFVLGGETLINLYLRGESESVDPAATMALSKEYLTVMLWGLPPFVVTQIYASSMRESGHSFMPMTAGVASVAVDVIFNYLLIFGKGGFPVLGVRGAAIATVAARFAEMAIVTVSAFALKGRFDFMQEAYRTLLVPRETARMIIVKGLPMLANEFLWAAGLAAITQNYSRLGLDIVAGLNISNALCNLLNVVFVALGNSVGIIIGQLLGASEYKKARESSLKLAAFTGIISGGITVVLVAFSGIFPTLYNTTENIRGLAKWFIVITALFFPVQGCLNALYFTLRSGGKTLITFLFDSVFSWVIVIPAAALLCSFSGLPILGIYAAVQSLDLIKVVIGYILIRRGVWINNIVTRSELNEA